MHHTLRFYSKHRESFIRWYIFLANFTRIPVVGRLVRLVANTYGRSASGAYLLNFDEANEIVDCSTGLASGPCTCRKVFHKCNNPLETELMIGLNRNIFIEERPHDYREITKQEAKEILKKCRDKGLVHTIVKCKQDFYALCNCCSCCCVPLRLKKNYGIGNALVRKDNIVQEIKRRQISQI